MRFLLKREMETTRRKALLDQLSYREIQKLAGAAELDKRNQKKVDLISRLLDTPRPELLLARTFPEETLSRIASSLKLRENEDVSTELAAYVIQPKGEGAEQEDVEQEDVEQEKRTKLLNLLSYRELQRLAGALGIKDRRQKKKDLLWRVMTTPRPELSLSQVFSTPVLRRLADALDIEEREDLGEALASYVASPDGEYEEEDKRAFYCADAFDRLEEQRREIYGAFVESTNQDRPSADTPVNGFGDVEGEPNLMKAQDMEYRESLFRDMRKRLREKEREVLDVRQSLLERNLDKILNEKLYHTLNGDSEAMTAEEKRLRLIPIRWRTDKDVRRMKELEEKRAIINNKNAMLIGMIRDTDSLEVVIDPELTSFVVLGDRTPLLDVVVPSKGCEDLVLLPFGSESTEELLATYPHIAPSAVYYDPESVKTVYDKLVDLKREIESY